MAYSYSQLKQIWTRNGGNPLTADMAAAIALAESSGNPLASNTNKDGSVDRGLWQINTVHGSLSTFDIDGNAKAAIQISANGANWRPWCTAWSDGACGTNHGSYLGDGSPYRKYLQAGNFFGNTPSADSTAPGPVKGPDPIRAIGGAVSGAYHAITSIPDFLKLITSKDLWLRVGAVVLGALLLILGAWKLMPSGVKSTVGSAAKVAAVA